VLDSGLGGLTVARALRNSMPAEDVLYFGDTARLPYGSKTAATVTTFVKQIIQYLRPHQPKHVVIACNTATALSLPAVRTAFPDLSISGVIEPGAKAAVIAAGAARVPIIGVMATEATVRSKAYERAIHRRRHHARLLLRPAPLLVPIIEDGRGSDDPLVQLALKQYLQPLLKHNVDVLVLGCTHYPILKDLIQELVGPKVKVIDSAEQCAEDVARRLQAAGLLRSPFLRAEGDVEDIPPGGAGAESHELTDRVEQGRLSHQGTFRAFVTDDPIRFKRLASRFLGVEIQTPTWVAPDDLYGPAPQEPVRLSVPA
jgi:glutamate racemase